MKGLDPITVEVITERLIAIVREMRATMVRTAYSMTVYEMKDFSCALFDGEGRLVAQSRLDLPVHVVPMPWSVQAILEDFEGDIHPGDVFLTNDVYRGGTHLNDVTMLYPVFEGERLAFFAANRSHWDDVGGMVPGSMSGLAVEVLQEGVRIPPIKVFEQGRANKSVMDVLYANMRVPEERRGDFRAMRSTCLTAEQRIRELLARHGADTVFDAIERNIERTAQRTREHIRALPDGTYRAEDYLEFFREGVLDPVMLRVAIVVRDDRLDVDFTGSSAQVAGVVNASLAVSAAGVVIALKAFFDPDDPINQGIFSPITFTAPPGTVVNASPPVPCGAHAEIRRRTISLTLAALARAHPERMAGDMQGTSNHTLIGGTDDRTGRGYVFYEVPVGGAGGFLEDDGPTVSGTVDWADNQPILPAEAIEAHYPLQVVREEIRADSGGHGRRRGGLGLRLELKLLARDAAFSLVSDRALVPPYGVLEGASGAPNSYWIRRDGALEPLATPGKASGVRLVAGDSVVACTAGGGGYGDPWTREPERVARDVADGFVSRDIAREHYGVVIDGDGNVDGDATAAIRAAPRSGWLALRVIGEDDSCVGELGRHRMFRLHPQSAHPLQLAEGDLVEVFAAVPVPLRGWVRVTGEVPPGSVALDEWGQGLLDASEDDTVRMRLVRKRLASDPRLSGGV